MTAQERQHHYRHMDQRAIQKHMSQKSVVLCGWHSFIFNTLNVLLTVCHLHFAPFVALPNLAVYGPAFEDDEQIVGFV